MSETLVTTEAQFEDSDDLATFENGFFGRNQESKTDEKVEQEEETQTSEVDETPQTDEQDEAELEQEIVETQPKKKQTVQERINEVVAQREEIRREGQVQLDKLRQEFEEKIKALTLTAQPTTEGPKEPTSDALKPDGTPVYALGEFDPQFVRDLTKFTLEQERGRWNAEVAEKQKQSQIQQEQVALQTQWNDKVKSAVTEYPDFEQKGRDLLNGFNSLEPSYAQYLGSVLMSMDKGPDVLYYLSNHPEEATSIVNSGAQKATLALGRIESRFLQSEQVAPKPKVTKAPPPPADRARGTNGAFVSVAPDTDDLQQFEREFFKPRKY